MNLNEMTEEQKQERLQKIEEHNKSVKAKFSGLFLGDALFELSKNGEIGLSEELLKDIVSGEYFPKKSILTCELFDSHRDLVAKVVSKKFSKMEYAELTALLINMEVVKGCLKVVENERRKNKRDGKSINKAYNWLNDIIENEKHYDDYNPTDVNYVIANNINKNLKADLSINYRNMSEKTDIENLIEIYSMRSFLKKAERGLKKVIKAIDKQTSEKLS